MEPETEDDEVKNFHEMEIDDRILKAIAMLGWLEPTLIQERAIPLILEGKDVLLRARTGSGKTAAFAIPVIQKILNQKPIVTQQDIKALVLAPSRELCHQICTNFCELTAKCSREVTCVELSSQGDLSSEKPLLVEKPDVVIATPGRVLAHLKAQNINLKDSLDILVIDEADLIFSFGYEKDVKEVLRYLPKVYQACLASATLSEDVLNLKQLVLHNAVVLKLQEPEVAPTSQLSHYHLAAEEEEKATILYALLKLNLVKGKTIVFVNTVDRCYRLKLYLEQFGIPACVLNSELPAVTRCHSVHQFNSGYYDVIIASDERVLDDPDKGSSGSKSKRKRDKESGVSRGIDFQHVSNVINFDFPLTVDSYVHRVGRTARGKNEGSALSFVNVKERPLLNSVNEYLMTSLSENNSVVKSYEFKLEEVEGFKYRAKDAWRAVTKIAIKEARMKEIKQELLNSQKLKSHFEDNKRDLMFLRHDKALHTVKLQPHLAHVPDYIVPQSLRRISRNVSRSHKKTFRNQSRAKMKFEARKNDPLLGLDLKNFKKTLKKVKK